MRIEQDLLYIQYDNLNNNRDIMYHRVLHSLENNYDENAQSKKTLRKTFIYFSHTACTVCPVSS